MIASVPIIFQCLRYQGKVKKVGVLFIRTINLFFFHAQVSQAYWDPDVYRYRVEMVIPSSLKTITTTATTIAVTAAAAVCNDNF